uniref:Uncharacterized protein n=1 Tax=Pipistrellus kuhlii TaxID=59472 RepID=A0A7J8A8M7_PIPKU|nr:hypothetical protein mPipKuh1_008965 [Pipistrellus kuhlii]
MGQSRKWNLYISSREGFHAGNWVTIGKRPGRANPDQGLQEIRWPQPECVLLCPSAVHSAPQGSWLAAAVTAGARVPALYRNPLLLLRPKANGFYHPILAKCSSLKESKPKILLAKESEKCCSQASSPYDRVRALEK